MTNVAINVAILCVFKFIWFYLFSDQGDYFNFTSQTNLSCCVELFCATYIMLCFVLFYAIYMLYVLCCVVLCCVKYVIAYGHLVSYCIVLHCHVTCVLIFYTWRFQTWEQEMILEIKTASIESCSSHPMHFQCNYIGLHGCVCIM